MQCFMYVFLLALTILQCGSEAMDEDGETFDSFFKQTEDRSKWVHPHMMGFYDLDESNAPSAIPDQLTACSDNQKELKSKLDMTLKDLVSCRKELSKALEAQSSKGVNQTNLEPSTNQLETSDQDECQLQAGSSSSSGTESRAGELFFKRHISVFLKKLGLQSRGHVDTHLNVELWLAGSHVKLLQKFSGDDSVDPYDVEHILAGMIKSHHPYAPVHWDIMDTIKEFCTEVREPLLIICLAFTLVFSVVFTFRILPTRMIIVALILVCFCWNYVHLYKKAWAAKKANLVKHDNIPLACRPAEMTWLQSLQHSITSKVEWSSECYEYHQALMVDPLYEVNPLVATIDLISHSAFTPLKRLGQQSGEMFKELLLILPAHVMFPVLALFAYMLMVMMVMASGYTIRLPFLLGEISPPVAQQPQLHHQHAPQQQNRITVREEKESIEQLPETRSEPVLLSQTSRIEEIQPQRFDEAKESSKSKPEASELLRQRSIMKDRKETSTPTATTRQENKLPPAKVTSSSSEELTVSSLTSSRKEEDLVSQLYSVAGVAASSSPDSSPLQIDESESILSSDSPLPSLESSSTGCLAQPSFLTPTRGAAAAIPDPMDISALDALIQSPPSLLQSPRAKAFISSVQDALTPDENKS